MSRRVPALLLGHTLAWLLGLGACSSPRHGWTTSEGPSLSASPAPFVAEPETPARLDPTWRTASLERFEAWVQSEFPGTSVVPLHPDDRAELAAALEAMDPISVRAAVVLSRSRDREAQELLLRRLEARAVGPDRPSDAGDVVAAAALGRLRNDRDRGRRLEELVAGERPHPDLEVRVECAATLLEFRRAKGIPFLLRVLREATPAADPRARDWTPTPHMAWAKSRAAMALSKYLGVPCTFRPDGSVQHQMDEAASLERRWRELQR